MTILKLEKYSIPHVTCEKSKPLIIGNMTRVKMDSFEINHKNI